MDHIHWTGWGRPVAQGRGLNPIFAPQGGYFPREARILLRAQKIHETIYTMLTQRLAMARVDEARDTAAFQVLDAPTVPTTPARPRRTRIAALATAGGLAVGVVFILAPIWWRRRVLSLIKQAPRPSKESGS